MKTILWTALLLAGLTTATSAGGRWHDDGPGLSIFYASLSPHGEWIAIEGGAYAWRPVGVANDWRPYWHGHWLWSDHGWYWWSAEPWAWAVYHYGRWHFDDDYGWVWIPGYDWAPAWVEWRYGDDFIGWAPLGPYAIYSVHIGIRYERHWVTPFRWWTFVGCFHFTHRELWRHTEPIQYNERLVHGTRTFGSIRAPGGRGFLRGPDRVFIEQRTNTRLPVAEVVDAESERDQHLTRADGRERIQVYRPSINRTMTDRDERERGPQNVLRQRQAIRLDPRGMERPAPAIREQGDRPERPDPGVGTGRTVRPDRPAMRSMPGDRPGRDEQPGWWNDERQPRRIERERPRRTDPGEFQAPRTPAPRGNAREGKREGR